MSVRFSGEASPFAEGRDGPANKAQRAPVSPLHAIYYCTVIVFADL